MGPAEMAEIAQHIADALRGEAADVAPRVSALKQRFRTVHFVRGD